MHYFHKVSHVTQNRLVVFLVYLFFAGFTNKNADAQDIIIKSAAVADYTPENVSDEKVKKKIKKTKSLKIC